jgi:VWFA-related protein
MRKPALAAAVLGLLAAQETTIRVDVEVVSIFCSVRNRKGAFVTDLEKSQFTVLEDGKQQEIRYFAREADLPLTIGLLVDVSRSQENLIEVEKHAASQFFGRVMREKDMAFLISFGSEAELLQDVTNSPRLLRKALEGLRVNAAVGGLHPGPVPTTVRGTILWDAVYLAANEKLRREVGRKVLVLITDGMDFGSRVKQSDAIEAVQKADAIVYGIYYVDQRVYGFGGASDSALRKLAEETGGRVFHVDRRNPLDAIFQQIQDEMRSQYMVGYTPQNPKFDGGFRRLEIRTADRDLKVLARKGYYAVRQTP